MQKIAFDINILLGIRINAKKRLNAKVCDKIDVLILTCTHKHNIIEFKGNTICFCMH